MSIVDKTHIKIYAIVHGNITSNYCSSGEKDSGFIPVNEREKEKELNPCPEQYKRTDSCSITNGLGILIACISLN